MSDITEPITKNTVDKWIAPEHKGLGLVENVIEDKVLKPEDAWIRDIADAVALAGAGGLGGVIGGDIGNFLQSDLGQIATSMFSKTGGGGAFDNFLKGIGITGGTKDMLEDVLTYMALAEAGELLAEDAINLANEYEAKERAAIDALSAAAAKYSDPEMLVKAQAEAVENTRAVYGRKADELEADLYARGLGRRQVGPMAELSSAAARAELEAMRDTELGFTDQGLRAQSYALGPLSAASERYSQAAAEEKMIPFEMYKSALEGRRESPEEKYLDAQLAQLKGVSGAGAGGTGAIPFDIDMDVLGLGLSGAAATDKQKVAAPGVMPQTGLDIALGLGTMNPSNTGGNLKSDVSGSQWSLNAGSSQLPNIGLKRSTPKFKVKRGGI